MSAVRIGILGGLSEWDGCGWFGNGCFVEFLDLGGGTFFIHGDSGGCFLCITLIFVT